MTTFFSSLQRLLLPAALSGGLCIRAVAAPAAQNGWAHPDADGKLACQTLPGGDHIVDFSHAGYGGGGVKLPVAPVQKMVIPSGGDDSQAIQSAIDAVAALPVKDGFRGAVLLAPGVFHCADPRVLILDEATSALDTGSEAVVQQALEHLMVGRTTFIIAHRHAVLRRANRILTLDKGALISGAVETAATSTAV